MRKCKGFLLACACLCLLPYRPVLAAPQPSARAYDLIAAVNALRVAHGLAPYHVDPLLMIAAQGQADYLASQHPNVGDGHIALVKKYISKIQV